MTTHHCPHTHTHTHTQDLVQVKKENAVLKSKLKKVQKRQVEAQEEE
jgi:hypothetical protein